MEGIYKLWNADSTASYHEKKILSFFFLRIEPRKVGCGCNNQPNVCCQTKIFMVVWYGYGSDSLRGWLSETGDHVRLALFTFAI